MKGEKGKDGGKTKKMTKKVNFLPEGLPRGHPLHERSAARREPSISTRRRLGPPR